ncbi:MAG: hypothetical protein K2P41_05690, partial [Lachnospiraceae bacterium]|nr:hypothetical protein [Lachnospiraceae bacterium]
MGGPDEQREIEGGGDDTQRIDLQLEDASEGEIPNLFELAGSTIPLVNEPVKGTAPIRPLLPQNVIDAALTLGANDPDSRLRIIAEFMKDKPIEENARFLQAHYEENGAGFYVGERKYSLWYNDAGMQIAAGESALTSTATAVTWEQAAERIRELLDEGRYASQAMLYRAWPYERNRVAKALQYLHRDIDEGYKDKYLPTLTAALGGTYIYPDVVDKTKDLLEQPEQLETVIAEYTVFIKDYAHNRDILRFRSRRTEEILRGLEDFRRTPLKFTASPDYEPVERFFISQDEIDNLLREHQDRHDYRIAVYNFFEQHSDRKEREKYLGHLHGTYSGYNGGNDNITYTSKELAFTHGDSIEPYAAVKMKWPKVRKRIEELIRKDLFLSAEDKEIMESRTMETPAEEPSAPPAEPEPLSEQDAKKRDILMENTRAYFASYEAVKQAHPGDIVLFQWGDFFEMYGPDARVASVELDIHLTNRIIPELGRVAMCGIPVSSLDKFVEILRRKHGVTISAVTENSAERQTYSLSSFNVPTPIPTLPPMEPAPLAEQSDENQIVDSTFNYRRLSQMKSDCEYFLGAGNRAEKYLWQGNIHDHIREMRRIYGLVPEKPEWLTTDEIDSYAQRMARRYQVVVYHHFENGFDERPEYQTLQEAEQVARDYVSGEMEQDGFQYDGAAVLDLQERQWVYVAGHFPVLEDGDGELPYLPYKLNDKTAQAPQEQAPTVRELYEKYKAEIITALGNDQPYRNACQNSDKDTACLEGDAAIKRAVLAAGDVTLTKLYFDNAKFHNDLHREVLEETYAILSEPEQTLTVRDEPPDEPSLAPQPHDPLAPAYQVGDTVYLDDTAFTITEIGLFDVQLQDPTQVYPILRAESKENFEKLLRRDERNLFITDYLTYTPNGPIDDGSDLRDALTSNGGLLGERSKKEVKEWLCAGEGNAEISRHLQEIFDGTSKTMTLETGETADYSIYGDRFMLSLLDKSHTVRMYDLWMVAGVLRDMYQRELGGLHHKTPYQVISPDTSRHGTFAPQDSITPAISQTWSKPVAVYPAEKTNLPFDIVIEKFHIEEPNRVPAPQNFHITDDALGAGGAKAKYQMNISALKTLHNIESESRTATPEEQETLSKYVGWGALADAFDESKPAWASEYQELREMLTPEEYDSARASVLNSHYTSPTVIKAIYQALENMGFQDGNILEPSCGVGNFFGLLPESMANSKLFGVELDGLTGRIARQLYPNAHIEIKGYEDARFQNNSFDIAIGNVPFGNYKVHDPAYNKLGFS